MIVQGTNAPLELQFDRDLSDMDKLVVTLWSLSGDLVKAWDEDELTIEEDTVLCPLTESETATFPNSWVVVEAKGLDAEGATIFWDEIEVQIVKRNDRIIALIGTGSE